MIVLDGLAYASKPKLEIRRPARRRRVSASASAAANSPTSAVSTCVVLAARARRNRSLAHRRRKSREISLGDAARRTSSAMRASSARCAAPRPARPWHARRATSNDVGRSHGSSTEPAEDACRTRQRVGGARARMLERVAETAASSRSERSRFRGCALQPAAAPRRDVFRCHGSGRLLIDASAAGAGRAIVSFSTVSIDRALLGGDGLAAELHRDLRHRAVHEREQALLDRARTRRSCFWRTTLIFCGDRRDTP